MDKNLVNKFFLNHYYNDEFPLVGIIFNSAFYFSNSSLIGITQIKGII